MFKLLIAEDEALAREAIERSIDFEALNFRLVASCEDGLEAWEAYQKEKPDLVLTDINMPNMSGLELAKAIYEDNRDCRVIILTGHDSFDFARQAISYQVSDYLLKPVTPQELRDILGKSAAILEEKAHKQASLQAQISQNYLTESLAKNQLLNRFISGSLDAQTIEASDESLKHLISQARFKLALLSHNMSPKKLAELNLTTQEVHFLLYNLAAELAENIPELTIFPSVENPIVVLCGGCEERELERQLQLFINELTDTFYQLTSLDFRSGYSLCTTADELPEAKEQADVALAFAMTSPVYINVSYSEMLRLTQQTLTLNRERLVAVVTSGDVDALQAAVSDYVTALRFSQLSKEELHANFELLNKQLEESDVLMQEAFEQLAHHLERVGSDHHPLQEGLYKQLKQGLAQRADGKPQTAKDIVLAARHAIERNFASNDLSLINLCAQLNVSMSYFSSIFKNETGQTFVEFLTDVRMRNAKKLLTESNLMLYTIAERVGYDSAAYFTAAFKKNTGFTPKEYRKKFSTEDKV